MPDQQKSISEYPTPDDITTGYNTTYVTRLGDMTTEYTTPFDMTTEYYTLKGTIPVDMTKDYTRMTWQQSIPLWKASTKYSNFKCQGF